MYVEDLIKQPDGRYTLVFKENGITYKQENMGLECVGQYENESGNDSDCRHYHVAFEVLTCYHPPRES